MFPTLWDARQLECCRPVWSDHFEVALEAPTDWDCPWDLDIHAYIEHAVSALRGRADGVTSSSDYPGATVAGAIATRLGLPGTPPAALVRCAHKYAARQVQQAAVPEATPAFALLDSSAAASGACALGFPCFVKPVKGAYSVLARRVHDAAELRAFLSRPAVADYCASYLHIFRQLLQGYTSLPQDGGTFLAESLLEGVQVTVEGWRCGEEVHVLGITDSVREPQTGSFLRFVFPSGLDERVQARMRALAARLVQAHDLRDTFFNIEMMYDAARDRIGIIEINPRLCGQFGDLYQKVLGVHSYTLALELAAGGKPQLPAGTGAHAVAASLPLRLFAPARVERMPAPADFEAAAALFPDTMIWGECEAGQELVDFDRLEDGASCRYAVINLGAPDRQSLDARLEAVQERLPYRFAPL